MDPGLTELVSKVYDDWVDLHTWDWNWTQSCEHCRRGILLLFKGNRVLVCCHACWTRTSESAIGLYWVRCPNSSSQKRMLKVTLGGVARTLDSWRKHAKNDN